MSLIQIIKHIIQIFKSERATGQMGSSPNGHGPNGLEPERTRANGLEPERTRAKRNFDIRKFIVKKNIINKKYTIHRKILI